MTHLQESDVIRLCVQTHHPIDTGNYEGPVHCTVCLSGTPCVTALYERLPDTTFTEDERSTCGRVLVAPHTTCGLPLGHRGGCR